MNVFKRELQAHLKATVIWAIALFLLLETSMAKFDAIAKGGKAMQQVLTSFPHSIQVMFGMDGLDITTARGYYGIVFLYVVIAVALHATMLGVELIKKEEYDKTSEFLYPKPVGRGRVLFDKLLAGIVILATINLITWLASYVSVRQFAVAGNFGHSLMIMMGALAIIQLVYFFFGFLLATISRVASRIATLSVVASYFLMVIAGFLSNNWLRDVTPIGYFNAKDLLTDATHILYPIACVIISGLFVVIACSLYRSRDLRV